MATVGTPFEGLDYAAARVYGSHLSLVCYANPADSLSDTITYADLTQPASVNGYAPITLDGTWSFNQGVVTYEHTGGLSHPRWVATGTWTYPIIGVAMVDISAGKVLHFKDNASTFTAANLRKFDVDITTLVS